MSHDEHDLCIGWLISLLSSVVATLGYAIQRKGHLKAVKNERHYLKEPNWILGFGLICISIPIYSLSLVFASQTATSMVPTLSILFVMFWSWLLLNEKMTRYELYGTLFLAPGTIVIMLSCNVAEGDLKSNALSDYILSNRSVLFLSIVAGIFMIGGIVSMYIIRTHENMDKSILNTSDETDEEIVNRSSHSNQSLEEVLSYRWNLVPMLYFPWFAGMFWCLASTLIKSWFINFEQDSAYHHSFLQRIGEIEGIVLLINIIIFTFISFFMLNKALYYFEPIYVLSFEKVSLLINNLLCGGIILDEFERISGTQIFGFVIGTILWIIGVGIFLRKKDQSEQMKDFISEEIQESQNLKQKQCT